MGRNECVRYYSDVCVGDCAFNPISGGKTQVDLCEFKATVRPERERERELGMGGVDLWDRS